MSSSSGPDLAAALAQLAPALELLETLPEPQRSALDKQLSEKMVALLGPEETWSDEVREMMKGMREAVEGSEEEDDQEDEEDEDAEWEDVDEDYDEEEEAENVGEAKVKKEEEGEGKAKIEE